MQIKFRWSAINEVEPVLRSLCASLESEFREVLAGIDLGQGLDQIAVIITVVNDAVELNRCRCGAPVSVSSNANFVTGEKSKVLTIRPTIEKSRVLRLGSDELRDQVLLELVKIVANISTKRILVSFDRDRFIELMQSKISSFHS